MSSAVPEYETAEEAKRAIGRLLGDSNLQQAADLAKRCAARFPRDPEFPLAAAMALGASEGTEALALGCRAVALAPDSVQAHGLVLQLSTQLPAAYLPTAMTKWAEAVSPRGDLATAENHIVERFTQDPAGYPLLTTLAQLAFRMGRSATALELYAHCFGSTAGALPATPTDVQGEYAASAYDADPIHHDTVARFLAFLLPRLAGRRNPAIADAACGSGLAGPHLRAVAERLVGMDLAPAQVGKARATGAYDAVLEGDMVALLAAEPRSFDVVACCGATYYLDDLRPFLAAATGALRPGGLLAFSDYWTFPGTGTRLSVGGTRRYARSSDLVLELADASGLVPDAHEVGLVFNLPAIYWTFRKPA